MSKKIDTSLVKWVPTFAIKNQNIWYMPIPSDSSWSTREVFKLSSLGRSMIRHIIGDGKSSILCLENWHSPLVHCTRCLEKTLFTIREDISQQKYPLDQMELEMA